MATAGKGLGRNAPWHGDMFQSDWVMDGTTCKKSSELFEFDLKERSRNWQEVLPTKRNHWRISGKDERPAVFKMNVSPFLFGILRM